MILWWQCVVSYLLKSSGCLVQPLTTSPLRLLPRPSKYHHQVPAKAGTAGKSRSCAAVKIQWSWIQAISRCALFQIIDYCNYFCCLCQCRSWSCWSRVAGQTHSYCQHCCWVISFVLPCVPGGFHTSVTTILVEVKTLDPPLERALWSWGTMSEVVQQLLLPITLIWTMNMHQTLNCNFKFWNNKYIVKIINIIVK
jgi:hypothetical protein